MKRTIFLTLFLALLLAGCGKNESEKAGVDVASTMGMEEAKAKAEKYLNENYGRAGSPALTINDIKDEGTVYKLSVAVPNGTVESYISKDGKFFFIEGDDLTGGKSDKPEIELFVMSHCPYGTQIEKGFLPVLDKLGDKVDFKLKFCGYAMHGEIELDEQLLQHCIQEEEPEKLIPYLECFLDQGVTTGCLAKANVDTNKINTCVESTDSQFKVKEQFADESTWYNGRFPKFDVHGDAVNKYGVSGSPTLIINGKKVNVSRRDPQSLLASVCNTFTNPPEECKETLPDVAPSAGFGFGESSGGSAGSCN